MPKSTPSPMLATNTTVAKKAFKESMRLMGNRFEITAVTEDAAVAATSIEQAVAEIKRIEALLTTFNEESQTALINRNAGKAPVVVDREVFDLIHRCLKISKLTQGAFDISYGSIDRRLWNFDIKMTALPDKETAKQSVRLINFRNIILDEKKSTVFLKEEGMRIGFGGIGKGYAADRAKAVLKSVGIESGVVNASGDLITWGTQPDGSPWTVGISDPNQAIEAFSYLNISNMAIATSGSYEKYAVINGKHYSHTIDPKTGLPVNGIKSVSIICGSAELADAMATPVMVMGVAAGLYLINQLKGMACIIVDDSNRLYTSENISIKKS